MLTALAFVLFFAVCAVLAFGRHPIYGLYVYLATTFVHPPSRWWGALLPDLRWALLAAAIAVLAILFNRNRLMAKPIWLANGPAVLLALYATWLWIQSPWALDQAAHFNGTVQFTKYLVAFWVVYCVVDSKERLRDFLFAHVLGCGLLGLYAMFIGRVGDRLDGVGGPGIDDANTLAMYLATGALAVGGIVLTQKGWRRYVSLVCGALILNAFVLANTRGAFLGLAAGGLVLAYCKARKHRPLFWSLAFAGVFAAGGLVDEAFVERMFSIRDAVKQTEEIDSSAQSRVELYNAQIEMFLDYPMGAGYRGTAELSPRYLDREWLTVDASGEEWTAARSSHNTFMSALVEQGVLGAILYLGLVCWVLGAILQVHRWNTPRDDPELTTQAGTLCGALVAVLVSGMTADFLGAEVQFWLYAGLASALGWRRRALFEASQPEKNKRPLQPAASTMRLG
jgi:hypothetical protein